MGLNQRPRESLLHRAPLPRLPREGRAGVSFRRTGGGIQSSDPAAGGNASRRGPRQVPTRIFQFRPYVLHFRLKAIAGAAPSFHSWQAAQRHIPQQSRPCTSSQSRMAPLSPTVSSHCPEYLHSLHYARANGLRRSEVACTLRKKWRRHVYSVQLPEHNLNSSHCVCRKGISIPAKVRRVFAGVPGVKGTSGSLPFLRNTL